VIGRNIKHNKTKYKIVSLSKETNEAIIQSTKGGRLAIVDLVEVKQGEVRQIKEWVK